MLMFSTTFGVFGVASFTLICIATLGVFASSGLCCTHTSSLVFMSSRYISFKAALRLRSLSSARRLSASARCSCCMRMLKPFAVLLPSRRLRFLHLTMTDLAGDGIARDVIDGTSTSSSPSSSSGTSANIRSVRNHSSTRFVVLGGVGNSASAPSSSPATFTSSSAAASSASTARMMASHLASSCSKNPRRACGIEPGVLRNKLNPSKLNSTPGDCATFATGVLWGAGGRLNSELGVATKSMRSIKLLD
mmetsp:Transcript_3102/g.11902  ORF Transcript_3102/g.11902 Transcript_3102/m.11902 type:complete len:249 (+) Transcript_3102:370-1116(+)